MWTTGPVTSAEAETATAELPDIFKMDGVRRKPTIPDNQEVAGEEDDDCDEIEELMDGFIASTAGHCAEMSWWSISVSVSGKTSNARKSGYRLPVITVECVGRLPAHEL